MYLSLKELGRETLLVVYRTSITSSRRHPYKDLHERYLAWYATSQSDGTPARPVRAGKASLRLIESKLRGIPGGAALP